MKSHFKSPLRVYEITHSVVCSILTIVWYFDKWWCNDCAAKMQCIECGNIYVC